MCCMICNTHEGTLFYVQPEDYFQEGYMAEKKRICLRSSATLRENKNTLRTPKALSFVEQTRTYIMSAGIRVTCGYRLHP